MRSETKEVIWLIPWTDQIAITQKVFYGPYFLTHKINVMLPSGRIKTNYANNVFKRLGWLKIGEFEVD
jgi:hypothetical protein